MLSDSGGGQRGARADIAVLGGESWRQGVAPQWEPGHGDGEGVVATEPEIIPVERPVERHVEIRSASGQVVTVIEVISPDNRLGGRRGYRAKQLRVLQSTAQLVEIDLVRAGEPVLDLPPERLQREGTHFFACAYRDRDGRRELYPVPLRERLPVMRIPLRRDDDDVLLDLQPLLDRVYLLGGYWQGDYSAAPEPPLPDDELAWVDERLRAAGLRG